MLIFAILLVSPALAHRKYKPHHKSLTRWALMRHSHEQAESVKSTTPKQSEAKKFDLLGGAFDVVAGAWKAIGNTVETILSGEERAAREAKPAKSFSLRRKYRFIPRNGSGLPRWVRKRVR